MLMRGLSANADYTTAVRLLSAGISLGPLFVSRSFATPHVKIATPPGSFIASQKTAGFSHRPFSTLARPDADLWPLAEFLSPFAANCRYLVDGRNG